MKKGIRHSVARLCLVVSWICFPLQAADTKLSDWDIGTVQVGEEVAMKDLKGQVVVFEYWGTR